LVTGRRIGIVGTVLVGSACSTSIVSDVETPDGTRSHAAAVSPSTAILSQDALETAIVDAIKEVRSEKDWAFSLQLLDDGSPQTFLSGEVLWIGAFPTERDGSDLEELCADVLELALDLQPKFKMIVVTDSLSLVERNLDTAFTYCEP
jgi:hypothetical protein